MNCPRNILGNKFVLFLIHTNRPTFFSPGSYLTTTIKHFSVKNQHSNTLESKQHPIFFLSWFLIFFYWNYFWREFWLHWTKQNIQIQHRRGFCKSFNGLKTTNIHHHNQVMHENNFIWCEFVTLLYISCKSNVWLVVVIYFRNFSYLVVC